jgi:predicted nucleotidyltransferase
VIQSGKKELGMIDVFTQKDEQIRTICRAYGVAVLSVFGSAAHDGYDPERSDIDLIVQFQPGITQGRAKRYFEFEASLREALNIDRIDLLEAEAITNPYFAREIDATRQVLYAA